MLALRKFGLYHQVRSNIVSLSIVLPWVAGHLVQHQGFDAAGYELLIFPHRQLIFYILGCHLEHHQMRLPMNHQNLGFLYYEIEPDKLFQFFIFLHEVFALGLHLFVLAIPFILFCGEGELRVI